MNCLLIHIQSPMLVVARKCAVSYEMIHNVFILHSPSHRQDHVPEVVYATPEQATSTDTRPQTQSSDSTTAGQHTITGERSSEQIFSISALAHSPLAPGAGESQHLVYAQLDFVKQPQVQPPPTNDDPVQYAEIRQQDHL